jgi:iron(III) transport system ATP-binding protein
MTTGLSISGLRKAYGSTPVLSDVDFEVPHGELAALIGRSGSGKTTLLRLIAGFDRPDAGTVTLDGRPLLGEPPERRRIGYVTQEGNLFPHLRVAANIAFGLPWRARRQRSGVTDLLDLVGLPASYADRHPHELSGGEQQRVALARALAPRPLAVLLDEPFSALDAEIRAATRQAVTAALAATRTTTVLVTHDRAEAMTLAARVAVLRDGAVVQQAPPDELYRRPADLLVAALVGDVTSLPARLCGDTAETAIGSVTLPAPINGEGHISVRPEQIVLTPVGEGPAATVRSIDFRGHDALVAVRLDDGTPVTARCAAHRLPEIGARVGLHVEGAALR